MATSSAATRPEATGPARVLSVPLQTLSIRYCPGPCLANTAPQQRSCASDNWRECGVFAGSERILCVKSGGKFTEGSSTRRQGEGRVVWSSAPVSPTVAVDAPRGSMMMSPTAGGRAELGCPHRTPCSRPLETTTGRRRARDALDGHEQGACILVHGGARVMVSDVLHEPLNASEPPCEGICCTNKSRRGKAKKLKLGVALRGPTQPEQQLETVQQRCAHVRKDRCSQTGRLERAPKPAQAPAVTDNHDRMVQRRARTETTTRWVQTSGSAPTRAGNSEGEPAGWQEGRGWPGQFGSWPETDSGSEGAGRPEWWSVTGEREQTKRGLRFDGLPLLYVIPWCPQAMASEVSTLCWLIIRCCIVACVAMLMTSTLFLMCSDIL